MRRRAARWAAAKRAGGNMRVIHVLSGLAMLGLSTSAAAADEKAPFRAGAYAMDVTPKKYPISVNGGMQDRQAKGAHDPLHARCLVLDDGATRIALVVVDSCMIPRDVCDAAKAKARKLTGIAPERILI